MELRVFYITMLFPAPSETFACNDVLTLHNMGIKISVHSLKSRKRWSGDLIKERNLENLCLSYNYFSNTLSGVYLYVLNPSLCLSLFIWILRHAYKSPVHLVKSFLLMPRTLQLFKEIKKKKPDVVHLFWGHYPSMLGYLVKKNLKDTVLSISLGAYDLGMRYRGSEFLIKQADLVTTFSEANLKVLVELGAPRDKLRVFYHGIDCERYKKWTAEVPKIHGKIVTVGRLIEGKNMDLVLNIFSEVRKKWSDSRLIILGSGPMKRTLKFLAQNLGISDYVLFPGHVSHKAVLRELKSAEIFFFMSAYINECLPNAVKEAMFCRCYSVVARTPGIDELIPSAEYGCVVEAGDIKKASTAIDSYFSEPDKYQQVLDKAHDYVLKNFDVKTEMGKLKKNWEKIRLEKTT